MNALPLVFTAPAILAALAALPVLWWLLRVTPPQPKRVPFPPLALFPDLLPEKQTPARTPWWLTALRMMLAALVILAASGPLWQPNSAVPDAGRGPTLLIIDNGASAARDWSERSNLLIDKIAIAERDGRALALVATAEAPGEIKLLSPALALERARALVPQPYLADASAHLPSLQAFARTNPDVAVTWISDRIAGATNAATPTTAVSPDGFSKGLAEIAKGRIVTVHAAPVAAVFALAGTSNRADGLTVSVLRPAESGRNEAALILMDSKGLPLGRAVAAFPIGATQAQAKFDIPLDLRNSAVRVEVDGERSALAVALIDDQGRRRRVGLISGASNDTAQPLISPTYYVARALAPFADLREPRGGASEAVASLIADQASVIVLADVGVLDRETTLALERFVDQGGVIIRFAGARLATTGDDLTPVRLRRGGRSLGGSLSWDSPKTLAPFPSTSPFAALKPPGEVSITRQILAEPGADLTPKTWAALADGTPIVTGERRGQGHLVLFHVTADPSWSSLPLSGLFVDMLRELVSLAGKSADGVSANDNGVQASAAPRIILDGFGVPGLPPGYVKPVVRSFSGRANLESPAGLYGPPEATLAVNVLRSGDMIVLADLTLLGASPLPIAASDAIDLRPPLVAGALLLLVADTLALMFLGGGIAQGLRALLRRGDKRRAASAAVLTISLMIGLLALAGDLKAQPAPSAPSRSNPATSSKPPISRESVESAYTTRLAYIITGDAQVDETSRAGLLGLTRALTNRTAFEPGDPVGVDPARDELAFYPLIYWPIVAGRALPNETALRRVDAFMKSGGTIIFDTRDAASISAPGQATPTTQQLRRMLATLAIPELEPLPRDHVLTKAFYLLSELPGRYATGRTWIEALPVAPDGEARPARSGDGISPLLITGNDLAAAWAIGRNGEPLNAMVGGGERQREMALRGGINLVIYALTGNYKTDQVHVGPLLERLGQ
jgi:Domain of unknown function (DUF4159)/Aerotolerance regulator N-terminal